MKSFISKFCEVKPLYNTIKLINPTLQNMIFLVVWVFATTSKPPNKTIDE